MEESDNVLVVLVRKVHVAVLLAEQLTTRLRAVAADEDRSM